jgi:tRNA(Ile)-lysidine synthase
MENSRNRQSPDAIALPLFSRIDAALAAHCPPGSRLLLAYSGGVDSSVLLHALAALRHTHDWRIECAHVHHGLSPHADAWADACAAQCSALDIPFVLHRVTVPTASPDGLESAARNLRYKALHAHARRRGVDVLLTGHHADDQAETLLHNMVRGAGLMGLAGMPGWREPDAERVATLRPLLAISRATLDAFARELGLSWIEDESNGNTRFARNYLRRNVMPALAARWPRAAETMAGVARRLAEAQGLLDSMADTDADALTLKTPWGRCFRLDGFAALDAARQRNLLRRLLRTHGARTAPNEGWLDEWRRQLCSAQVTAECPVAHAGVAAFCHRGMLWLMPDVSPLPEVAWHGDQVVDWAPGRLEFETVRGRGLALSAIESLRWTLRARVPGDRLQRGPARPRAGVKQIAQEAGLPPWLRDRMPILLADGRPVWMPGCEVSAPFLAGPEAPGWLPVWRPSVR